MLRGAQDASMNIKQQLSVPEIITMQLDENLKLHCNCDLIKIKGFIVDKHYNALSSEKLIFMFNHQTSFEIPFSFMAFKNIKSYGDDKYFIEFPHDYFFNHKIEIIKLLMTNFCVKITNSLNNNFEVKIVVDKYFLDVEERKLNYNLNEINYNIRHLNEYHIMCINHHVYKDNLSKHNDIIVYEENINATLLTQGIFIVKKDCYEILDVSIMLNKHIPLLCYDKDLLNIYGENISDNLVYYGFNVDEKYDSNNLVGCVNLSRADCITIKITVKTHVNNFDSSIQIYLPSWNILKYNQGLVGLKFI
jgi:hypothetical protein